MMMKPSEYDYLERPRQFDRDDFWRQVRRTVKGQPVEDGQIRMIVDQVVQELGLLPADGLIDIGCGNGALTRYFEPYAQRILGVDYSRYLLEIAQEYFATPRLSFELLSIENLIQSQRHVEYGKALLYGVSSYLTDELLTQLVGWYFSTSAPRTLFVGNIRDKALAAEFYDHETSEQELSDPTTSIGKWRTRDWFRRLAQDLGLELALVKMPSDFYLSHYYFDAIFTTRSAP